MNIKQLSECKNIKECVEVCNSFETLIDIKQKEFIKSLKTVPGMKDNLIIRKTFEKMINTIYKDITQDFNLVFNKKELKNG